MKNGIKYDLLLIFVTLLLLGIGVLVVYSSSYYGIGNSSSTSFLNSHLKSIIIGLAGLIFFSVFPYKWIEKLAFLCIIPLCLGFILLKVGAAKSVNGSERWVKIMGFSFMPSEWAKIFIIILMAKMLKMRHKFRKDFLLGVLPYIIFGGFFAFLILKQPNMSDAVIVMTVVVSMVFVSGMKWKDSLFIAIVGSFGVWYMITSSSYRMKRFMTFKDPFVDPLRFGYQQIQSLYALGSGGLFGVGLGLSTQNKLYIPEPQNDFILATIGEELGFLGISILMFLFLLLIYKGFRIALDSNDRFGFYLAFGISMMITLHVIINFLVVASLMPVTGITLPLISFGGNSILVILSSIGMLINISKNNVIGERKIRS